MKKILIIVIVILLAVFALKYFKHKQNVSAVNDQVTNSSEFKEYRTKDFSFKYNSNAQIVDNGLLGLVVTTDRTNGEKGLVVQFRDKKTVMNGDDFYEGQGGGNYVCEDTKLVGSKTIHECQSGDTTDTYYQYVSNSKMLQFIHSALDSDALSDTRYIDLSSVEIY